MQDELEKILRETLEDHKLSRTEKRDLNQRLEALKLDEHHRDLMRHRAFELARGETVVPEAAKVLDWLEEVVKLLDRERGGPGRSPEPSRAYFSPADNCAGKIARLIGGARQRIDVCVFTITDDRITDALLAAHRRRVPLRIISDNQKATDLGSDVNRLSAAGIPVRIDRSGFHMHHKYAVFDQRRLLTGSYNWTRSAALQNEENFLVTADPGLTLAYTKHFEQLWRALEH